MRWDSDHVVIFNDDLQAIAQEIVRGGYLQRVHIGLDYFDASINRIAAWVIGARNTLRALLTGAARADRADCAQLEASRRLHAAAGAARRTQGTAVRRGVGLLLLAAGRAGRPAFMDEVRAYEKKVLAKRGLERMPDQTLGNCGAIGRRVASADRAALRVRRAIGNVVRE